METSSGETAVSRHILILDRSGGDLASISRQLESLEYRIVTASNCSAARLVVEKYSKLCLVLVNLPVTNDLALRFFHDVHRLQPDIPVFWIGSPPDDSPLPALIASSGHDRLFSDPPPASELRPLMDEVLHADFYSDSIISLLSQASAAALDAFHMPGALGEPFLKANRTSLAELNAILSFSGRDTAGHILVGSSHLVAQMAAEKLLARSKRALVERDIADVLGELANRILGNLLAFFEARGTPVQYGLPVYLEGGHGKLWNERRSPSLGLEFEGPHGALFVELAFTHLGQARATEPPVSREPVESEGCVFL